MSCIKRHVFQIKMHVFFKSRRETASFDQVCFREGLKPSTQEFKMASNRFYIPNANQFFEGLLSLLHQCGDYLNENTDRGARIISCKTSRGISTHFAGDVWSSYGVGSRESAYPRFEYRND